MLGLYPTNVPGEDFLFRHLLEAGEGIPVGNLRVPDFAFKPAAKQIQVHQLA